MPGAPDYVRNKFAPMLDRTLRNALAHQIAKQFPRIGGPRIRLLCADMILETLGAHLRPRDMLRHGQVLWSAISVNDPPTRHKRIADTDLVPVVLDLSTADDIHSRLERQPPRQRLQTKAVRLCRQAFDQNALLSLPDLAELLCYSPETICVALSDYEQHTGQTVPRRSTVHDVGTGLTHKRIICRKRYLEGKSPDQIARETYHSLEAVDRYLGHYDRIRHCRQQGMSPEQTAYILNCSLALVHEYRSLDQELEAKQP